MTDTPRQLSYRLPVLPPEHRAMKDPRTGVDLLFVTTGPTRDLALYFHQRSWLADESMLLFQSFRPEYELMGYLVATGELARIVTPQGPPGGVRPHCLLTTAPRAGRGASSPPPRRPRPRLTSGTLPPR